MSMVMPLHYAEVEKEIYPPWGVLCEVVSRASSLRASVWVEVIHEVQVPKDDVLVEEVVERR